MEPLDAAQARATYLRMLGRRFGSPPVPADLWDDESGRDLTVRQLRVARETDSLSTLPIACTYRAGVHVHAGEFDASGDLIHEADAISAATGGAPFAYLVLILAAWRGDE